MASLDNGSLEKFTAWTTAPQTVILGNHGFSLC